MSFTDVELKKLMLHFDLGGRTAHFQMVKRIKKKLSTMPESNRLSSTDPQAVSSPSRPISSPSTFDSDSNRAQVVPIVVRIPTYEGTTSSSSSPPRRLPAVVVRGASTSLSSRSSSSLQVYSRPSTSRSRNRASALTTRRAVPTSSTNVSPEAVLKPSKKGKERQFDGFLEEGNSSSGSISGPIQRNSGTPFDLFEEMEPSIRDDDGDSIASLTDEQIACLQKRINELSALYSVRTSRWLGESSISSEINV